MAIKSPRKGENEELDVAICKSQCCNLSLGKTIELSKGGVIMKKLSLVLILLLVAAAFPNMAFADASPWTEGKSYQEKMFRKLDFGLKNLILGPTHIISEPLHGINDGGFMGGINGLGSGLVHGVEYTVGGALHAVTFPITNLDIPLPNGGTSCACSKK